MNFEDPRFEPILARFRGRADLARRVLNAYVNQAVQDMEALASATYNCDREQIRRIAHRIKGASANAGIEKMRFYAEVIETLARDGDLGDVPAQLRTLNNIWQDFANAIEKCLDVEQEKIGV